MTPNTATPLKSFQPENLLGIEEVARRLRNDVAWVREKVRRRRRIGCPYTIWADIYCSIGIKFPNGFATARDSNIPLINDEQRNKFNAKK
jgi:hypothetical protein